MVLRINGTLCRARHYVPLLLDTQERVLISSSKVATYDIEPEMQAITIAKRVSVEITSGRFGVVVINFANPDMVDHTGNLRATVKAIAVTDTALGVVLEAIDREHGMDSPGA
jgi:2,3-bisphosphoglycerate-independent phosphoglycerate mutase